ncbi:MAG: FecR domain-containing protein, partial [Bryobacteraceae bacterium]
ELTFTDQTLTRLGANTIFGFNEGTRNLRLSSGAMLLHVPKNDGGARINTATVTAAITGTTVMMEYHPDAYIKFIVLEGTGRIFRNNRVGESVLVHAGQMLIVNPKGKSLPDPVDVDLKRLMETSDLITGFDPLASMDLITREIQTQTTEKNNGGLIETNLVIFGGGTAVSLVDPTDTSSVDQANANLERQAMMNSRGEKPPTPPTLGETSVYNGGAGNWSNLNKWTPAVVPIKGNRTEKLDVTVNSGTLTQDIVGGVNVSNLFMNGGTLVLANPLTLEAGLQFSGGNITGGTLNVAGKSTQSAVMGVNGTTINNSGAYDITLTRGNVFSGSATFNNSGTLTLRAAGGTVSFNNVLNNTGTVSSESGTFSLSGGGVFSGAASAADGAFLQFSANYSFTDGATFAGDGTILFTNNTASSFSGMIHNSGRLLFDSGDLVLDADLTLTGGGAINLVNSDRIRGSGILTNVDNVFAGETRAGSFGNNKIGVVNESHGVISANVSGFILDVDPNPVDGLTNQGSLQATGGGILRLNGNGGGAFANTGGLIVALDDSQVTLANGAVVIGGTLETSGSGEIHNLNSATLASLTNSGTFIGDDSSITTITGTITNKGSISLNSTGNATDLILAGNVTLTGGGTINLERSDRIRGGGILTNLNNVIQGETNTGSFGNNKIGIVNRAAGLIDANVSGSRLLVDPNSASGLTNLGIMQASNGGILLLTGNGGGAFANTGGLVQALAGSEVELTGGATIGGGILTTSNGGILRNLDSATLNGVSLTGTFIANDNSITTLVGTITDTGDILLNSTANTTDLVINNNVTLTGGKTLTLLNSARVTGSGTLFIGGSDGTAFTIHGDTSGDTSGGTSLGNNDLAIVNRSGGLIDADGNGLELTVDPRNGDGFINQGILRASDGGVLVLTGNGGGAFANSNGLITALSGSEVQLSSNVSINGGTLSAIGTGVIRNLDSATLNSLTLAG